MRNWIHRTGTALAATAAIGLMGCGSDAPVAPTNGNGGGGGGGITGAYNLQTVNGNSLPVVTFQQGNDKQEITAGSVSLNADNTASLSLTIRETVGATVTTQTSTDVGTYAVTGNQVTFTFNGSTLVAVLNGGTLSFSINQGGASGITLVFQK